MSVSQGPPPERARTAAEAARALGVTERTFYRWKASEWFPGDAVDPDGSFDLGKILAARPVPEAETPEGKELTRLQREMLVLRSKRMGLDADLLRLKVGVESGELIDRREAELFLSQALTATATRCDDLPSMVGVRIPRKLRPIVEEIIRTELDQRRDKAAETVQRKTREFDQKRRSQNET